MLDKEEEMYFTELMNALEAHRGNIGRLLAELVEEGLLQKREDDQDSKKLSKTYYSLTKYGKLALKIYELESKIEKEKTTNFKMEIKGGKNTNIQTENLDLKIEYK